MPPQLSWFPLVVAIVDEAKPPLLLLGKSGSRRARESGRGCLMSSSRNALSLRKVVASMSSRSPSLFVARLPNAGRVERFAQDDRIGRAIAQAIWDAVDSTNAEREAFMRSIQDERLTAEDERARLLEMRGMDRAQEPEDYCARRSNANWLPVMSEEQIWTWQRSKFTRRRVPPDGTTRPNQVPVPPMPMPMPVPKPEPAVEEELLPAPKPSAWRTVRARIKGQRGREEAMAAPTASGPYRTTTHRAVWIR
ncbi:hypothetical protein FS749_009570 [Ceratobasidium sp. UAMH 11750]|nr:hypothetical protein FS749_009570 [Ceratobasidium sp. UAMH 11750]